MAEIRRSQQIYLEHAGGLLIPGHKLPNVVADPNITPGDITAWTPDERRLLIEEGRRQIDRQQADFKHVQTRAQWLLAIAVVALGSLGAGLAATQPSTAPGVLWALGMVLLVYGVLGVAAVIVARGDFRTIHTAIVSHLSQPIETELAKAYAGMMADGENTVATKLTVLRQAVVFSLSGGVLGLIAALIS